MKADYHIHTPFSDGRAEIYRLLEEARDSRFEEIGLVDHCSPINDGANQHIHHDGLVWESFPEEKYARRDVSGNIEFRSRIIDECVTETEGVVPYMEYENGELYLDPDDGEPLRVLKGVEVDYNPSVEQAGSPEEYRDILDRHEEELESFLEPHLEEGRLDYLMGSIHYVNVDGEPRYVKLDDKFSDLSKVERREVVDTYFEKMEHMVESEIFDILAHPSLIERNDLLMDAVDDLEPYYAGVLESLAQSSTVTEFNGKGVERQEEPSVFWSMAGPHVNGSDSHRIGEMGSRAELFDERIDADPDALSDLMRNGGKAREPAGEISGSPV